MSSYFSLMLQLLIMMCLISLFSIPLMMVYSSADALQQTTGYWLSKYSIGNLGGSQVECYQAMYTTLGSRIDIQCPAGLIDLKSVAASNGKEVFDAGIIQSSSEL